MIDIDLRPLEVKYRAIGIERLQTLRALCFRIARGVLPMLLALSYLQVSTAMISRKRSEREAELRKATDSVTTIAKQARAAAATRAITRQARERAAALRSVFVVVERIASSEVSLSELRAQGNSVVLEGEAAGVSTLQVSLSELVQHLNDAHVTIESIQSPDLKQEGRYSRFSIRILLFAKGEGSRNRDDEA